MVDHNSNTSKDNVDKNDSLRPLGESERNLGALGYMALWVGDGVNMGNMTLGASVVVVGVATLNVWQTMAAALIAIGIISLLFALNDRVGYRTGIPYVTQLKLSFGSKGTLISSLLRAIPAVIWYGIQSWIGGTALNEIFKIVSDGAFDNVAVGFIILLIIQILLSMKGFESIKWVESVASVVLMGIVLTVFFILIKDHRAEIMDTWVSVEGTWGLAFFGYIMVFLGNYAAIFLSAADYSRELKTGYSDTKRGLLYFLPIVIAYGSVIAVGAMLATVTGYTNPALGLPALFDNVYVDLFISVFIVFGAIAVNMVANIVTPTYVIQLFTKLNYKIAVTITGLLAMVSFPWVLVQDDNAKGLDMFVLIYSAFLGPMVAILLVEYYLLRKQKFDVDELYEKEGQFTGVNPAALIAMLVAAALAFIFVDLAWIIGFVSAAIIYPLITKFAFKDSKFKKGTIYE
ncbi:NCS1 family transporter [Ornithinibacillus halophilus]|uniref:Nucleobase:cation symporter-1, NCS1 family n=1 Tax=Ornithinibacillus halophilus TaxID=930117 RepID=A0A1M5NKT3_9BACI|nr:NCS1 family transporter [Ornithinibacillus halophilus]SHG90160.1 nucleobase:cation symporter-1, NCS1 family [Ornithinibacillus halophilus]